MPARPFNEEVTHFLDALNHPLRNEIEQLRRCILDAYEGLSENIKWNGPNYSLNTEDRITMRIQPPKQVQLVFHRGAKTQEAAYRLIDSDADWLDWRANDRAVATFKTPDDIESRKNMLTTIIRQWLDAAQ